MPLEPENQRLLDSAQGFLELGMPLDASAELECIDPDVRHLPEVLAVRVGIYQKLEKWDMLEVVAKKLAIYEPDNPQWTVAWATGVRHTTSVSAARSILIDAARRLPSAALLHFEIACYECQSGNFQTAKAYLKRAIELQPELRLRAMDDDDLRQLWENM